MTQRTCSVDGCTMAYRARGYCGSHYNQTYQRDRHAHVAVDCTVCGKAIARSKATLKSRRPVCSPLCRTALDYEPSSVETRWADNAAYRAHKAGARVVEAFDRVEIFERDGWSCRACHTALSLETETFDPLFPTVDHIVPLSRGGAHARTNVQTLCLMCNSLKRDIVTASNRT